MTYHTRHSSARNCLTSKPFSLSRHCEINSNEIFHRFATPKTPNASDKPRSLDHPTHSSGFTIRLPTLTPNSTRHQRRQHTTKTPQPTTYLIVQYDRHLNEKNEKPPGRNNSASFSDLWCNENALQRALGKRWKTHESQH